jgi:hypothetical protein
VSETQSIVEKPPSAKVRDIPPGFNVAFTVGGYRVKLDFDERYGAQIVARRAREDDGEDSNIEIYGPDPELTIGDVVSTAKHVIEMLIRKR